MQLTIADVITNRTYHFEANEKDNSPNTEHLGFDTSQMAAIPRCTLILVSVTSPDKDRLVENCPLSVCPASFLPLPK